MNKKQIKQKPKKPKFKKTIDKNASKKIKTDQKQKVLVVAQELKFARLLAGNEKKSRDKVLKVLKKWLQACFLKKYEFKEDDFLRVWKGLFYAVWMSDKPLVQEELCENISEILDQFPRENIDDALKMFSAGFRVLATEWYGIDQHRMDKFLMLARRYLRASFRLLHRMDWDLSICEKYSKCLSDKNGIFHPVAPLFARNAISLLLHLADCFIEELSKVSQGSIPADSMAQLLHPFAQYMCQGTEIRICVACRQMFNALIRQSEVGLEYQQRTKAWEQMGCPEGGPDSLAPVSDDDNDSENDDHDNDDDHKQSALDPRAGRVDVWLVPLPVPSEQIVVMMKQLLTKANARAHTRVKVCMKRFEELSKNEYPLKVRDTEVGVVKADKINVKQSSVKLTEFESELKHDETRVALQTLSRKKRKKLLSRARSGEDVSQELEDIVASANGKWKVEDETDSKKEVLKIKKRKLDKNSENKTPNGPNKKIKLIVKDSKIKKLKASEKKTEEKVKKSAEQEKSVKKPENKPDKKNFTKQDKVKLVIRSPKVEKPVKMMKTPEKLSTPKKVKFELKRNSMQKPIDYYKSVRQSPNIPYDSDKKPVKTNLKPNSAPSPINPFFKKKLRIK